MAQTSGSCRWSARHPQICSRCLERLDLNQGSTALIGMYCGDVDIPGPAMTLAVCVKSNPLTDASRLTGLPARRVAAAFA